MADAIVNFIMGLLYKLTDLAIDLADRLGVAYLEWYKRTQMFGMGDLLTNTRDMFTSDITDYVQLYKTGGGGHFFPTGTPWVCLKFVDDQFTPHYVMHRADCDVLVPERLIVYFKVASRSKNAEG